MRRQGEGRGEVIGKQREGNEKAVRRQGEAGEVDEKAGYEGNKKKG